MVKTALLWALALLGGFAGTFWLAGWMLDPLVSSLRELVAIAGFVTAAVAFTVRFKNRFILQVPPETPWEDLWGEFFIGLGVSYLVLAVLSGTTMAPIMVLKGYRLEGEGLLALWLWTLLTPLWFLPLGGAVYAWLKQPDKTRSQTTNQRSTQIGTRDARVPKILVQTLDQKGASDTLAMPIATYSTWVRSNDSDDSNESSRT